MPAIPKALRSFLTWEIVALVLVGGELLFEGLHLPRRQPAHAVRMTELGHRNTSRREQPVLKKPVAERRLTSALRLQKTVPVKRNVVLSAAGQAAKGPAKSPRQIAIAKPKPVESEQRPAGKLAACTKPKVAPKKEHGVEGTRLEIHGTMVQVPVPPSQRLAGHGSPSTVVSAGAGSHVPAAHPTQKTIAAGREMPKNVVKQKEAAPIKLATYTCAAGTRDAGLKKMSAAPGKVSASVARKSNPAPVLVGTVWKADYGERAIFLWFEDRGKGRWCEEPICWRMDKTGIVHVMFEDGQPFFLLKLAQEGNIATEKQQTGRLRSWTRLASIASILEQPQPAASATPQPPRFSAVARPPVRSCACSAYQACPSFDQTVPFAAAPSRSTPSLPGQR